VSCDQQKSWVRFLILSALLGLCACGGGGGDEGPSPSTPPNPNVGRGSLSIEAPTENPTYTTESAELSLSGAAFISPTSFRCCSGSATDTGVEVGWSNAAGGGGAASQSVRYCTFLGFGPLHLCDHTWSAWIPLVVGANVVTVTATDPSGNIGRDTITVTRLPDTRPPTVSSTTPIGGAANISTNASIHVRFNEAMDGATISPATFGVTDSGGNPINGTVLNFSTSATFDPSGSLAGLASYTATITTDVRDVAGNAMAAAHVWTFTTGLVPDTTPPTVTSTAPPDGSTCAGSDTRVTASFSESINASTVTTSTFSVTDGNRNPISGAVSALTATSFAFTPFNALSFSTAYSATLTTGIRDLAGNALGGNHSWTFNTVPAGIGAWQAIVGGPFPARYNHSAVWTGTEMIVWGGFQPGPGESSLRSGGRYNPNSAVWVGMTENGAPTPRNSHVAVWTGNEMIAWGGIGTFGELFDGARYNPVTDTWRPMSNVGATVGTVGLTALWTGSEMLVWGRGQIGGRYNPATDSWRAMSAAPVLLGTIGHTAIWTGSRMIVWGGARTTFVDTGAAYDPATDTWEVVNANGAPAARGQHSAVWTGTEMAVWGGNSPAGVLNSGALYDPQARTWRPMSACGSFPKSEHTEVWTGGEMIVWGGTNGGIYRNTGQRYSPLTDSWQQLSVVNAPAGAFNHTAVWTGSQMIVWDGGQFPSRAGATYQP
jgi:N-acetylneuraminic acid mutarotase